MAFSLTSVMSQNCTDVVHLVPKTVNNIFCSVFKQLIGVTFFHFIFAVYVVHNIPDNISRSMYIECI